MEVLGKVEDHSYLDRSLRNGFKKIFFKLLHVSVCVSVCTTALVWRSGDSLQEPGLSLHRVDPGD